MENNFIKTCRTCSQSKDENCLISLYEIEQIGTCMYKDMLYDCTSIEIFADDNLPSMICQQCATILLTAYNFKQECYLSDQKFKRLLDEERIISINNSVKNTVTTDSLLKILAEDDDSNSVDSPHYLNKAITGDSTVTALFSDTDDIEIQERKNDLQNVPLRKLHSEHEFLNHKKGHKKFACNYCNILFTQSGSLTRHMRNNHNFKEFPKVKKDERSASTCTYCGKLFRSTYDLKVHVRRHTGVKPHICKTCNMSFVSMGRLTSHSRIHTGETPFTCKICKKSFSHSSTLYRHVQSHKKPHVCDFCQKRFTFLSCLETHKRMHSGLKPHECKTCGKGFTEKKLLQRHYVVHEKDKPHLCNVCGKNFKRNATLKKHLKTQHDIGKNGGNVIDKIAE